MSRSHRSIGEVLSLLADEHPDLTISKIRYLESEGLISPQRTPSGYRKFDDSDVNRLNWVLIQQRDNFLPLREIKRRLASGAVAKIVPRSLANKPAAELTDLSLFEVRPSEEPEQPLVAASASEPDTTASAETATQQQPHDRPQSAGHFTREQLAQQVGVEVDHIVELQRHGIVVAAVEQSKTGNETVFSSDALLLAETAAALANHGIQARNLRMFKIAADREAGVYEQLLAPLIARGDKERFLTELTEIIDLTEKLRRLMLLQAIRSYLK